MLGWSLVLHPCSHTQGKLASICIHLPVTSLILDVLPVPSHPFKSSVLQKVGPSFKFQFPYKSHRFPYLKNLPKKNKRIKNICPPPLLHILMQTIIGVCHTPQYDWKLHVSSVSFHIGLLLYSTNIRLLKNSKMKLALGII